MSKLYRMIMALTVAGSTLGILGSALQSAPAAASNNITCPPGQVVVGNGSSAYCSNPNGDGGTGNHTGAGWHQGNGNKI